MGAAKEDGLDEMPAVKDNVDAAATTCKCCASEESATTPVPEAPAETCEKPSQVELMDGATLEASARAAWTVYRQTVGGKAFNGDPLPTWEAMVADPMKATIIAGWRAAAKVAIAIYVLNDCRDEDEGA
jgi:hypothetical protein